MAEGFTINKAYASRYNTWRQKEELQKLKDKYGDEVDDSDSDSETEDENAEELTAQVEKDWLRTLSALKSKDPKIYQKDVQFYHQNNSESPGSEEQLEKKKKKKEKPVYLKDVIRRKMLEEGGELSDEEDMVNEPTSLKDKLSYSQEQEKLKKSVTERIESDNSDEEEDLLTKKSRTGDEKVEEDEDFRLWLKGQKDELAEEKVGVELSSLKDYWSKPDLHSDEKFLRDYILNQRYKEEDEDRIPTYDEVVASDDDDFYEEEDLIIRQENFERKYNFRFEEPEGQEIKSYPRTLENTLRQKDTKRSEKRKEIKERQKQKKAQKHEELKQLKNLKKQEISSKIEKLKEITGNTSLGFTEAELDEDFDPQKYDEMMEKCFNADYYQEAEEETKPVYNLSDDELQPENWDKWAGEKGEGEGTSQMWEGQKAESNWEGGAEEEEGNYEPHLGDADFCMDADYDPSVAREKKKKKKKKGKLAEALEKEKPAFDPNEKSFEQYLDEYYKLDCEDIIDDIRCRFKYRKSVPNSFGLTTEEILTADERDLNAWVSLKKMSQYRTEEEEYGDLRVYSKKGRDAKKKERLLPSLFRPNEEESETKKNDKGKKSNKRPADTSADTDNVLTKKKKQQHQDTSQSTSDETLLSVKKEKKQDKDSVQVNGKRSSSETMTSVDSTKVSKKKKKKERSTEETVDKVDNNNVHTDTISDTKRVSTDVKPGGGGGVSAEGSTQPSSSGKKKNKKKKKKKNKGGNQETQGEQKHRQGEGVKGKVHKKKEQKQNEKLKLSDDRLKAYGINPQKYKYMKREDLEYKHKA